MSAPTLHEIRRRLIERAPPRLQAVLVHDRLAFTSDGAAALQEQLSEPRANGCYLADLHTPSARPAELPEHELREAFFERPGPTRFRLSTDYLRLLADLAEAADVGFVTLEFDTGAIGRLVNRDPLGLAPPTAETRRAAVRVSIGARLRALVMPMTYPATERSPW